MQFAVFLSTGHNNHQSEYLRAHPETKAEGNAAVYGAAASIPDAILEQVLRGRLECRRAFVPPTHDLYLPS